MAGDGILSGPIDVDGPRRPSVPERPAPVGTRIESLVAGVSGVVAGFRGSHVVIRDGGGREHLVRADPGLFRIDGVRCTPVPGPPPEPRTTITASGSIAAPRAKARVARGARILVEGIHDAELVEKVWGDDLRHEGVVVERLDGADDLVGVIDDFGPTRDARLGVLLDHLVDGSKEQRIAAAARHPHVLVTGHPFVDVWAAVRPSVIGLDAWPDVPKGEPWKAGVLRRIGRADIEPGRFWKELLGRVTSYRDLQAPLVGAVEELIDFVTEVG
jgi:hypothetical protein